MKAEASRHPRPGGLQPEFAHLLPELIMTTTPEQLAAIAEKAMRPKEESPDEVGLDHLHGARVTVRDEAENIAAALMDGPPATFTRLIADAEDMLVIVVRFLALLEMYRDHVVGFAQEGPLEELTISWIGEDPSWSAERLASDDYTGEDDS